MAITLTDNKNYSDIAAAIREKNGLETKYKPNEMAAAIKEIQTGGGGVPEDAFYITGDCQYRFANDGWNWFINNYGSQVKTAGITDAGSMFLLTHDLKKIPFEINFEPTKDVSLDYMFKDSGIEEVPKINNAIPNDLNYMFASCYHLKSIPDDFASWFNWDVIESATTSGSKKIGCGLFQYCRSLRKIPMDILKIENQNINSSYSSCYMNLFSNCSALDEVKGLPVHYRTGRVTSNALGSTFVSCDRLKSATFETNEDGTPIAATWKNQTIELSTTGFGRYKMDVTDYNSGITAATEITNDDTYTILKSNPDSWTINSAYSRYNRTSAVETINSLPDVSAGSGCKISFLGAAGEKTDGGAINTMTEEEIAVATAKGWTVTFK